MPGVAGDRTIVQVGELYTANPADCWLKTDFVDEDTRQPNHVFVPALYTDNEHLPNNYKQTLEGAGPKATAQVPPRAGSTAETSPRALFDQYCVTCHNRRTDHRAPHLR